MLFLIKIIDHYILIVILTLILISHGKMCLYILYLFLVIGERPDDYETRPHSVDLEKIISLSELFVLDSVSVHDENNSSEPLKQNFITKLQCLLDKLKWYDVHLFFIKYYYLQRHYKHKICII